MPDGWAARVATIGEAGIAEVEVDDCVELEPQAAPDAATTAATAMSRTNLDVPVMEFTIPPICGLACPLTSGTRALAVWIARI